ncbi:class I SAM-dependent methyltransferase [Algoriphagus ornithinivorans]|uniref:class I SAM-dependent methyltransferase n=1 Tax=Algoriphagus ornithinivorans TaxID=226506 RepID=UPI001C31AE3B|nr:class I SAM-dependent methyltransferase [Algoriphagus ornithinivorans]
MKKSILASQVQQSEKLPKVQIDEKSLKSARLLPNREALLELFPRGGVVAELGVDQGGFSEKILKINQPKTLHLVDLWSTERYHLGKRKEVEEKFSNEISKGEVSIHIGYSTEVVEKFEKDTFDWIYIDTNHSYATTKEELELWSNKVKPNGIIAGHDYIIGNWNGLVRYGVIEAVHEFCLNHDWEILYLTMELHTAPSFAIRRRQ